MVSLKNKVIIITGACGGIGKAYTKALLENNVKGIGLIDINEDIGKVIEAKFNQEFGMKKVVFVKCDVSDMISMKKAFQFVIDTYNQLDIVINNAGIIDELNFERAFAINVIGVINGSKLAKELIPRFKKDEEGIIINTSSVVGLLPGACLDIYSATKAAVVSYGRSLGSPENYQKDKIKVITVCPGGTESNLYTQNTLKNAMDDDTKANFEELLKITSLQSPHVLSKKVIEIIKKANHGDVWVVHEGKDEIVNFPLLFTL